MILSERELDAISTAARSFVMASNKHVGGGLSSVETIVATYFGGEYRLDLRAEREGRRDNFVLSKGHAPGVLYFCLWLHGFLGAKTLEEMLDYGSIDSDLPRMPYRDPARGFDMGNGALGQGLSFANGLAVGDRIQGRSTSTIVLLGDAECAEGQIWEAANTTVRLGLNTVTALLDANQFGSGVEVDRAQWRKKWESFGWTTIEVDGHDMPKITEALREAREGGPCILILRTVKGNGLPKTHAGTNQVHNRVSQELLPSFNIDADVVHAQQIVQPHLVKSETIDAVHANWRFGKPVKLTNLPSFKIGEVAHTKRFMGSLVDSIDESTGIVLLTPDALSNSGLQGYAKRWGSWTSTNSRSVIFECPIAEQDTASLSGGIAATGTRAVLFLMEGFVWRLLDSLRQSICHQSAPVVVVATSGGIGDELGPMVQSDACFAAVCALPGITTFEAADINEAMVLFNEALSCEGPAYLRLPHERIEVFTEWKELNTRSLQNGCWIIRECMNPQLTIITSGSLVPNVLKAADLLCDTKGKDVRVVEVFSITRFAQMERKIRDEFLPTAVPTLSVQNAPSCLFEQFLSPPFKSMGCNRFGYYGKPTSQLYERAGLGVESILSNALEIIEELEYP